MNVGKVRVKRAEQSKYMKRCFMRPKIEVLTYSKAWQLADEWCFVILLLTILIYYVYISYFVIIKKKNMYTKRIFWLEAVLWVITLGAIFCFGNTPKVVYGFAILAGALVVASMKRNYQLTKKNPEAWNYIS